jgi:hypothetical protein
MALLMAVILLTAFRIHGSSIGIYNTYLRGESYRDPNLIFGQPQQVRGDEWLVASPFIASQAQNGYPRVNPDVGYGQDMSIMHADMPYLEWSTLFRPLNVGFFVLPLENAFALKWWLLSYLLAISSYLLILELLPGRIAFAALLSLAVVFSPFIQWFYLTSTIEPLAYALLALFLFVGLIRAKTVMRKGLSGIALGYVLVCFALVLYPPPQIACALSAAFFAVGYLVGWIKQHGLRASFPSLGVAVAALISAGGVTAVFVATRFDAIRAVTGTIYPGGRVAETGTYPASHLFASHLQPLLQSEGAVHHPWNQTEASSFLFIAPFLLIPSSYLAFRHRDRVPTLAWSMLFISVAIVVLSVLMLVPGLEPVATLLLLGSVPSQRLVIGLGLLGVLQLVLLYALWEQEDRPRSLFAWQMAVAALTTSIVAGLAVRSEAPRFVSGWAIVLGLSAAVAAIVYLFLRARFLLGAAVLLIFSMASVFRVNPLYRGLDPLQEPKLGNALKSIGDADGGWVVVGDFPFEQIPRQYGLRSFSGVYFYPQPRIWRPLDPEGTQRHVWNRYAHVIFSPTFKRLKLGSPDTFGAPFRPCSSFVRNNRIRHVLSVDPLRESQCLARSRTVSFPARTFYIYRVIHRTPSRVAPG